MLKVENLQCGYRNGTVKAVINPLNFSSAAGEMLLLAGRNGIGKSTLLRTLSGLQAPLSGLVEIEGKNIATLPPGQCASLVSVLFSTPPELAMTSCGEVVLAAMQRNFSIFQHNFDAENAVVKNCLEQTEMGAFYDRDFASLSDGEKQKVMLARCLAQGTPVLVLDEPLAFLDYPSRRKMLQLLQNICKQQNKIIIYSSHDLDISLQFCDRMLLLQDNGEWALHQDAAAIKNLDPVLLF